MKRSVPIVLALLAVFSVAGSLSAGAAESRPAVGAALPTLALPDLAGHPHRLTELGQHPCALFFFCGCAPCHETARLWSQVQQTGDLKARGKATVIVFLGDGESAKTFAAQTGIDLAQTLILTDPTDQTGQKFGVIECPRVFVADAGHHLIYTNPDAGDPKPRLSPTALVSRTLTVWRRLPTSPQSAAKKAVR